MTVILDPGNAPQSYTDAQRRQWQNTAGLWKTDYGTSQSALTAMTNDRNYWQHTVAHNDPNVWTNQYNAGYSAGSSAGYTSGYNAAVAAVQPPGSQQSFASPISGNLGSNGGGATWTWGGATDNGLGATNNSTSITIPKTGIYVVSVMATGNNNTGNAGDTLTVTLSGNQHGTLFSQGFAMAGTGSAAGYAHYRGALNAGEQVSVAASTNFDRYSISGLGVITFIPTAGYPK